MTFDAPETRESPTVKISFCWKALRSNLKTSLPSSLSGKKAVRCIPKYFSPGLGCFSCMEDKKMSHENTSLSEVHYTDRCVHLQIEKIKYWRFAHIPNNSYFSFPKFMLGTPSTFLPLPTLIYNHHPPFLCLKEHKRHLSYTQTLLPLSLFGKKSTGKPTV